MKPKKWACFALIVFFMVSAAGMASAEVTTKRDDKGVWFIKGSSSDSIYDVFEAMGYAVATDRLWQSELYRRTAKGELAAIFGPDYLEQDILARITGYTNEELTAGYNSLDQESKDMLDGYVAGFNRRIAEIHADPSQAPFEFHVIAQPAGSTEVHPLPWTAEDVLAWQAMMLRNFDTEALKTGQIDNAALLQYLTTIFGQAQGYGMFDDLRWLNDPAAYTYIPGSGQQQSQSIQAGYGQKTLSDTMDYATAANLGDIPASADLTQIAGKINSMFSDREQKLKDINAFVKMGSYAWVVSGDKTASGEAIIYSGPQMGFSTPAVVMEGSIDAAGLKVSGMAITGLPGIIIGRTPHHAWSMQVGHARTVDYYFELPPSAAPDNYTTRIETIQVAGQGPVSIPVSRTSHGPVINPIPFNPSTYVPSAENPIIAWKYSHWGREFQTLGAFLDLAKAQNMDEFEQALYDVALSQHFCYADRDGNIAYFMSGLDPVRPGVNAHGNPVDWRVPQGMMPGPPAEWSAENRKPLSTDRNTSQGFYAGWNNKSSPDYPNSTNNLSYFFGPFHRAHVLGEYLAGHNDLTFEQVRDLALNIAATDSFGLGGNPWAFVKDYFRQAVAADPLDSRMQALAVMDGFDGHFVAGGPDNWATGQDRSDAWILADAWIREVIKLTFTDELSGSVEYDSDNQRLKNTTVLFNVLLHGLAGDLSSVVNNYNWFQNQADAQAPQTPQDIILTALDNVLANQLPLNLRPWGTGLRGEIEFEHPFFDDPVHTMPFSSRSTYAHCVAYDWFGQKRIESMFPLGQSGTILMGASGPEFDPNFFSMTSVYDDFSHRNFPVFRNKSSSDTCFIRCLQPSR
jgi:penicillin amidase